jgi:hypothetical protein
MLLGTLAVSATHAAAAERPVPLKAFLRQYCSECHDAESKKGGLDLAVLKPDFADAPTFAKWVRIFDRVHAGEMPPPKKTQPPAAERDSALKGLSADLNAADVRRQRELGRVALRRLNRSEYENTLRDLFGMPGLAVKELLPEDGRSDGFDKVSDALEISAVQMRKYLEVADLVLDEAIAHEAKPVVYRCRERLVGGLAHFFETSFPIIDRKKVDLDLWDQMKAAKLPLREQHLESMQSLGYISNERESFHPEVGAFSPIHSGMYRIKTSVWSFYYKPGEILPAERMQSVALLASGRLLTHFDAPSLEPRQHELVVWLNAGEKLSLNAANLWITFPSLKKFEGPGVAMDWMDIEGPLNETWPPLSHCRLFGELPLKRVPNFDNKGAPVPEGAKNPGKPGPHPRQPAPVARHPGARPSHKDGDEFNPKRIAIWTVESQHPEQDAARLLADFLPRAFRRPVAATEVAEYVKIARERIAAGDFFESAMRAAYRVALCSPDFLFLNETAGTGGPNDPALLDPYALACRLSYFLWNSMPDEELTALAAKKQLSVKVIQEQVNRMLADQRSERFIEDFTDQWLDLRNINFTSPDGRLYPEFRHDLRDAIVSETRAYFREMLNKDLGAAHVIDSDFVMINQRLAEHYGISGVVGSAIRRVPVPPGNPRGGFITQGAVLKLTANGTVSSPVTRGVWIMDRILGKRPAPPPPDIPAVDPDTRGATTLREQLDKHRNNASCAGCHAKMDPPGFALENFDVIGGWRTRYRHIGETGDPPDVAQFINAPAAKKFENHFRYGLPVDAAGTTVDGKPFKDIHEFKRILLTEQESVARNFVQRVILYATGAPVSFADRAEVERILDASRQSRFGFRTILNQVTQSPAFLHK